MYRRTRPGQPRTRWRGTALPRGVLLLAALAALAAVAVLAAGCGRREAAPTGVRESRASQSEWAWLQKARTELEAERARLAANPADPQLAQSVRSLSDELNRRLAAFLNADPPVQGSPLTPRQRNALRMKSDEDIQLAHDFIERGGDYQRAIDIYKEALALDPDYPRLQEELARAQARRYVPRDLFAQVQKGMDQDEVRRLLGQPNLNNVRSYPDRGVVGWFYPKDSTGAAAAVWFHKEEGKMAVYLADFDALQPPQAASPGPSRSPQSST